MKFLADQDVYQVTIEFLRTLGHDVLRAGEAGLSLATDQQLLERAYAEDRLLLTRDKGFGALVFLEAHSQSGVILLRIAPQSIESVHQELARLLTEHDENELKGCFVVIEPGRHRIRWVLPRE